MQSAVTNLVLSLAAVLAEGCDLTLGQQLWAHQAGEMYVTGPYAVLRCYGGPKPAEFDPTPAASLQVMVSDTDAVAALDLAGKLFDALYSEGMPRHHWIIPAKRIGETGQVENDDERSIDIHLVTPLGPPGIIGRDASNSRWLVSFNFDVHYHLVTDEG